MLKQFARIIFVLMTIKEADVTRSHQSRSKPPEGLEPGVNFKLIMDQVLMNMVSFLKEVSSSGPMVFSNFYFHLIS